jgi:hypothetical protein
VIWMVRKLERSPLDTFVGVGVAVVTLFCVWVGGIIFLFVAAAIGVSGLAMVELLRRPTGHSSARARLKQQVTVMFAVSLVGWMLLIGPVLHSTYGGSYDSWLYWLLVAVLIIPSSLAPVAVTAVSAWVAAVVVADKRALPEPPLPNVRLS